MEIFAGELNVEALQAEEKEYPIAGGRFFADHPEKILGEPYETSGRFGKVKSYRAIDSIKPSELLQKIETPQFISHGITDISAGKTVVTSPETAVTKDEIDDNIVKTIETTEKNIVLKKRAEKQKIKSFMNLK